MNNSARRIHLVSIACTGSLMLFACGGGGGGGGSYTSPPPPQAPTLMSVAVTPANESLTTGQTQQFTAQATYSDGSTKDVTASAAWSSSSTTVATISTGGLLTSLDTGRTNVGATVSGVNGTDALTVNMPIPATWTATGVDYGLKKQCIRTVSPGQANFFVDNTDCPGAAYPSSGYWTTAVETENTPGSPCIGVVDQSFLINGTGSPVSEAWSGSSATGYSVELKTDFTNVANPCAPNTFTWVPLMDNFVGGGPLPPLNQLVQQFTATFNRTLAANNGATRAMAGVGAQWNISGPNGASVPANFTLEVNFYIDEPQWGVQANLPADVITVQANPNSSPPSYYVALDGTKLFAPISAPLGTQTTLVVNWAALVQHVIDEGLFPAPINGWSNSNAITVGTYTATEVQNFLSGIGGPMADLMISDYEEGSF
jgi:hypothetical protein